MSAIVKPATTNINIGISEFAVSNNADDILVTYSLGSCVGVSLFDPIAGVGGLIHCMLPSVSPVKKEEIINPITYVDSGVIIMLQKIFDLGGSRKSIICKVSGCGTTMNPTGDLFKIGERNYTMLRKVLWKNNIFVKGELVGGSEPKTMYLEIGTGKVFVKHRNEKIEL